MNEDKIIKIKYKKKKKLTVLCIQNYSQNRTINVTYDHLSSKSTNNLRNANSPSNHQVRESMVMSDTIKKPKTMFGTSDNHMPTKYLIWLLLLGISITFYLCGTDAEGFFSLSLHLTLIFLLTFKQNLNFLFFYRTTNIFFSKVYTFTPVCKLCK